MALRVIKYNPCETYNVVAGEDLVEGQFAGISSAGTAFKADCDATHGAAATNRAVGVVVKSALTGKMVALAPIATVDGFTSLTKGGRLYLSDTAGAATQTQTTTDTQVVQELGIARTATEALINVRQALKYQTAGNSVATFL